MDTFTLEEVEARIRNGEIIYDRALENNAGAQLLAFLRKDIAYWKAILDLLREQQPCTGAGQISQGKSSTSGHQNL